MITFTAIAGVVAALGLLAWTADRLVWSKRADEKSRADLRGAFSITDKSDAVVQAEFDKLDIAAAKRVREAAEKVAKSLYKIEEPNPEVPGSASLLLYHSQIDEAGDRVILQVGRTEDQQLREMLERAYQDFETDLRPVKSEVGEASTTEARSEIRRISEEIKKLQERLSRA